MRRILLVILLGVILLGMYFFVLEGKNSPVNSLSVGVGHDMVQI